MEQRPVESNAVGPGAARGVQIGDGNVQYNTFRLPDDGVPFPGPEQWPPVGGVEDPVRLGVHRTAPGRPGEPPLPPYVPRECDPALRAALGAAAGGGGLVVLVGESTAGKSRSAFEAARAVLPGHRLLHPAPHDLPRAAGRIGPGLRVLLWLDDLEQYLGPGRLDGRLLQFLKDRGVVVLATLRTEERARLAAAGFGPGGDGPRVRDGVLDRIDHLIPTPRRWSAAELGRARAAVDSRLADALAHAEEFGVGEYLAAGPDLLQTWIDGWAPGTHPRGAALVNAAVDCRRAGLLTPVPAALLEELHPFYLRAMGGARLHPEPFDRALEWATAQVRATTGLLLPAEDGAGFTVFDYLVDTWQRDGTGPPVPDHVWEAVLRGTDLDPARASAVALAAAHAERYDLALRASRPWAGSSVPWLIRYCLTLGGAGQWTEARQLLDDRLETGGDTPEARALLTAARGQTHYYQGDLAAAERELRAALAEGASFDMVAASLGGLLIRQERPAELERLARPYAERGDPDALLWLAVALDVLDRPEEAEPWFGRAVDAGSDSALFRFATLALERGDEAVAEERLRRTVADGGRTADLALDVLIDHLWERGRYGEAEPLVCRRMLQRGQDPLSLYRLGGCLLMEGRPGEAEPWLLAAAATDSETAPAAKALLADLYETARRPEEAERWRRAAAADGVPVAMMNLGLRLLEGGSDEGLDWLRRAGDAGLADAYTHLAMRHLDQVELARHWLRRAVESGSTRAGQLLAMLEAMLDGRSGG